MPKKTRQEKILAKLHRLQQEKETVSGNSLPTVETKISLNLKTVNPTISVPTGAPNDYSYVYSDLRKTLIFAVVALIFEVALSRFV